IAVHCRGRERRQRDGRMDVISQHAADQAGAERQLLHVEAGRGLADQVDGVRRAEHQVVGVEPPPPPPPPPPAPVPPPPPPTPALPPPPPLPPPLPFVSPFVGPVSTGTLHGADGVDTCAPTPVGM